MLDEHYLHEKAANLLKELMDDAGERIAVEKFWGGVTAADRKKLQAAVAERFAERIQDGFLDSAIDRAITSEINTLAADEMIRQAKVVTNMVVARAKELLPGAVKQATDRAVQDLARHVGHKIARLPD